MYQNSTPGIMLIQSTYHVWGIPWGVAEFIDNKQTHNQSDTQLYIVVQILSIVTVCAERCSAGGRSGGSGLLLCGVQRRW